jgi:putative endonuclease
LVEHILGKNEVGGSIPPPGSIRQRRTFPPNLPLAEEADFPESMYKVYILVSVSNPKKKYVGLTTRELKERLKEHNSGDSYWTKRFKPWKVVYYEMFYCKQCAEYREKFLKSGIGRRIRDLLADNGIR